MARTLLHRRHSNYLDARRSWNCDGAIAHLNPGLRIRGGYGILANPERIEDPCLCSLTYRMKTTRLHRERLELRFTPCRGGEPE